MLFHQRIYPWSRNHPPADASEHALESVQTKGPAMIILTAMLASGQVLPFLDRPWLEEQARREAAASPSPKPQSKPVRPASAEGERKLPSFENTIGM